MYIREANINDLNDLFELQKLFIAQYTIEMLKGEIIDNPITKIFVYEIDNKIVGFIDVMISLDNIHICQLGVNKDYQNKKIASNILEYILKIANENNIVNITLEVRENNIKAISLYQKYGFKKIILKEKYYSNGDNAVYMMKGISNNE